MSFQFSDNPNETQRYISDLKSQIDKLVKNNDDLMISKDSQRNEYENIIAKLAKEKEKSELRIESLSNDLEQQFDECIELNSQLLSVSDCDTRCRAAVKNIFNKINPLNKIDEKSLVNLVEELEKELSTVIVKTESETSNIQNMSIIDLENMHIDTLCWQEGQKGRNFEEPAPEINDCQDKANSSCYNLDNLDPELLFSDSKAIIDQLEELYWDDLEKIDSLMENSISILLNSVLLNLDCGKSSKVEIKLKKVFSDYGNFILRKIKTMQATGSDLNSTFVFEKLEQELVEMNEVKKQLDMLSDEKATLLKQVEESESSKKCGDDKIISLMCEIEKLSLELESNLEKNRISDSTSEELRSNLQRITLEKEICESKLLNLTMKQDEVEETLLGTEIERLEMEEKVKTLQIELNESNLKLKTALEEVASTLKLEAREKEAEIIMKDYLELLEKQSADLNNQLKEIKSLKSEIDILKLDRVNLTLEKEDYKSKLELSTSKLVEVKEILHGNEINLVKKEEHINLLENQLKTVQSQLEERDLELESSTRDCFKVNEEMADIKSIMAVKESQLLKANSKLKMLELELKIIEERKENMVKDLQNKLFIFEKQSLELRNLHKNIQAMKKERIIASDNVEEVQRLILDKQEMQLKINKLECEYNEIVDVMKSVQEVNNLMKVSFEELQLERFNLIDHITLMTKKLDDDEKENQYNLKRIEILETEKDFERTLKKQLPELKEVLIENNRQVACTCENNAIQIKCNNLEVQYYEIENKLKSVQREKKELEILFEELEGVRIKLTESITKMKDNLDETEKKNQYNEEKVEKLELEIKSVEEKAQSDLENAENKIKSKEIRLDDLERKLSESNTIKEKLEEKTEKLELKIKSVENDLENAVKEIKTGEAKLDYFERNLERLEKELCNFEETKRDLQLKNKEINNCEIEIASLRTSLADMDKLKMDIEKSSANLTACQKNLDDRDSELRTWIIKYENSESEFKSVVKKAESDLENRENKIKSILLELSDREEDIKSLKNESFELNKILKEEVERIMNDLAHKESRISQILARLKIEEERLENLEIKLQPLAKKLIEQEHSLENIRLELEFKNNRLKDSEVEIDSLRISLADMDKFKIALEQYIVNLKTAEKNLDDKEFELRTWKNKYTMQEKECENSRLKVKNAWNNEEREKIKFFNLFNEFESYKRKHSQENLSKLQEEVRCLKEELMKKSAVLRDEKEFTEVVNAYNELKDRYREKRKRTEELNMKYEKLLKFCKEKGLVMPKSG